MRWDVFCRVIDNHGDLGVAWRFARDLAVRGETVRLYVDDPSALAWMAPPPREVEVRAWGEAAASAGPGGTGAGRLAGDGTDVVVETFGCDLPDAVLARMARARPPPLWLDLQYLSAEPYVERSHALPSPRMAQPGAGLVKRFWFPGFSERTGGLLRETDLARRQRAFDAPAWRAARGLEVEDGERLVSLFCYQQPALPALLERLAARPTLLLATPGHATRQVETLLGPSLRRGVLRAIALPALPQPDYDHLLWASDLNFVRGEDSFVRAQWAGRPFVWQIYSQQDAAHRAKLEAFIDRMAPDAAVATFWRVWNGFGAAPVSSLPPLPSLDAWTTDAERWRTTLWRLPDLTAGILRHVGGTR